MNHLLFYQGPNDFYTEVGVGILIAYIIFIIHLYIFRSIFNIPSFLRFQRAQIRLLEEMAKKQGVDSAKVHSIISESMRWEGTQNQPMKSEAPE